MNTKTNETFALCAVKDRYISNAVDKISDVNNFHKRFETYDGKTFCISKNIPYDSDGVMVLHVNCTCGKAMPVAFKINNGLGTPTPEAYCCSGCQSSFTDKYMAVTEYGTVTTIPPFFCYIV